MTLWASRYIGTPFKDGGRDLSGLDCWGLARLVLAERAGLDLPYYDGVSALDGATVRDLVRQESKVMRWLPVVPGEGRELDVVLMRGRVDHGGMVTAAETHVGVIVGAGQVLHIEPGIDAAIESMNSVRMANRITRIFRHEALA